MHEFFESYIDNMPNNAPVPPERRADIFLHSFSDSVTIAVPLGLENDIFTAMNGVYAALAATCGMSLLGLANTTTLRGGIDIGIAAKIHDNEIYGPALERAYFLETNLAEYPRFIVGKELVRYLHWVENRKCDTRLGQAAAGLANLSKKMITEDTDGRLMLDFMGKGYKASLSEPLDNDIVKHAFHFVLSQCKYYFDNDNEKLYSRYFRLSKYFDSRAKLWGL